jgi:teichoic acid transport system ATP-binding protein
MAVSEPSVIADDVHVTYRALGGRRNALETRTERADRMFGRVTKHVGSVTDVPAVRGVSFVVHKGESVGVVGRNGSGKSTLLRAIAGLIPIASGAVYVGGEVSLLGVNAALVSDLSGERNIMLGGLAQGLTRKQVRAQRDAIAEFADIGEFVHLPMKTYSSGMAARLRFAISAAVTPDVLIIDEALATGDADFRQRSAERVAEIREEAGTVFLVSHSLSSIRDGCTRALWLDGGVLRQDGPVDEVCDAYEADVAQRRAARKKKA